MAPPLPESLREISVSLPADLVDYLFYEAERAGVRPADILQQALSYHRFLVQRTREGANVLLDDRGKLQRVDLLKM